MDHVAARRRTEEPNKTIIGKTINQSTTTHKATYTHNSNNLFERSRTRVPLHRTSLLPCGESTSTRAAGNKSQSQTVGGRRTPRNPLFVSDTSLTPHLSFSLSLSFSPLLSPQRYSLCFERFSWWRIDPPACPRESSTVRLLTTDTAKQTHSERNTSQTR